MGMRDDPGRRAHEVPRLPAEVEADLEFRNAPVSLHGGPRVAFDRQTGVLQRPVWSIVHRALFRIRFERRHANGDTRRGPRVRISFRLQARLTLTSSAADGMVRRFRAVSTRRRGFPCTLELTAGSGFYPA